MLTQHLGKGISLVQLLLRPDYLRPRCTAAVDRSQGHAGRCQKRKHCTEAVRRQSERRCLYCT